MVGALLSGLISVLDPFPMLSFLFDDHLRLWLTPLVDDGLGPGVLLLVRSCLGYWATDNLLVMAFFLDRVQTAIAA